jgi:hypothetical protein
MILSNMGDEVKVIGDELILRLVLSSVRCLQCFNTKVKVSRR